VVALNAPVFCMPLVVCVPLQPAEAVQLLALVELQVKVELPPLGTTVGYAVNVASGMILTMAVDGTLVPPGPVQVNEYAVGIVSAPVLMLPLAAWAPLQPPPAVQEAAFVALHVNIEAVPLAIEPGAAVKDIVGTGGGADE
jgi:hypothetical protein